MNIKNFNLSLIGAFSFLAYLTFFLNHLFVFTLLVPIFYAINYCNNREIVIVLFILFFLYNVFGTLWLVQVDVVSGVLTWLANAVLMLLTTIVSVIVARKFRINTSIVFISFWLFFEQIHLMWNLSWSWLNIGNVLGNNTSIIQWYNLFGSQGGSAWIIGVNYCAFLLLSSKSFKKNRRIAIMAVILFPIIYSIVVFYKPNRVYNDTLQINGFTPNIDFTINKITSDSLLQLLNRVENFDSASKNALLVLPENIVSDNIFKGAINDSRIINKLRRRVINFNYRGCILGSVIISDNGNEGDNNVIDERTNILYSKFCASIFVDSTKSTQVHVKRRLIPVEEYLPKWLNFLNLRSDKLSHSNDYENFKLGQNYITPLICYEALFGEDIAKCINEGGEAIVMIANEQIFSYKQATEFYKGICKIRAIENNRFIAKISNRGFTGIIDTKGQVQMVKGSETVAVLKYKMPFITAKTFYSKNAQFIHLFFLCQPICILCFLMLFKLKNKTSYTGN